MYESGEVAVDLVLAKGRVAPIKLVTIPRLELKGAVVLAHLIQSVVQDLHIELDSVYAWTDSTIVLAWLKHDPTRLTVYVGNRVKIIQSILPSAQWRHVPGTHNPADCLSRGLKPVDLCQFKLWWNGPDWLMSESEAWPLSPSPVDLHLPELRRTVLVAQAEVEELGSEQQDFQSWVRTVAWIKRFWFNYTHSQDKVTEEFLTSAELLEARNCVFRSSQRFSMPEEHALLRAQKSLSKHHHLYSLTPFIDVDGLMKVGGRLEQFDLPDSAKHPVILSRHSHSVKLFVESVHRKMFHPPMSAAMAAISFTFHIPMLKPMLKSICKKCVQCQRKWARPIRQKMGDLPAIRSDQSHVFCNVRVDYAGPVYIFHGRGIKPVKTYIALFVCMTTRAVHLELAADATTASFLAVLDRFCGRRGTPNRIFSDNGGNFRGAANELHDIMTGLSSNQSKDAISKWSSERGLKIWSFQPACSPHRGGLWEAGVKTMKGLIRQQLHELHLQMDELNTIVVSAEAIMNLRPYITLHSTDPDALCPLTPGHLLINRPLCSLPQHVDIESKLSNVRHWELVKRIEHQNWEQFKKVFLPQMAARARDMCEQDNLCVHDVVLVMGQDTRRNQWPLGLVTAVFPGPDGLVRTANFRVETSGTADARIHTTLYRRAVQHLVKMPIDVT